jgi:hypothetical protein
MNTAIQELIHFIENDRMQSSYTKEQVLELLTFKLEKEKEQIMDAFNYGQIDLGMEAHEYYEQTLK